MDQTSGYECRRIRNVWYCPRRPSAVVSMSLLWSLALYIFAQDDLRTLSATKLILQNKPIPHSRPVLHFNSIYFRTSSNIFVVLGCSEELLIGFHYHCLCLIVQDPSRRGLLHAPCYPVLIRCTDEHSWRASRSSVQLRDSVCCLRAPRRGRHYWCNVILLCYVAIYRPTSEATLTLRL